MAAAFEDAFGRVIQPLVTNTSEMKELLKTLMTGKVGAPTVRGEERKEDLSRSFAAMQQTLNKINENIAANKAATEKNTPVLQNIARLIEQINPRFAKEAAESKQYANASAAVANAPPAAKAERAAMSPVEKVSQGLESKVQSILDNVVNMASKLVSIEKLATSHIKPMALQIKEIHKVAINGKGLIVKDAESTTLLSTISKDIANLGGGKQQPATLDDATKGIEGMQDDLGSLTQAALHKGTVHTKDDQLHKALAAFDKRDQEQTAIISQLKTETQELRQTLDDLVNKVPIGGAAAAAGKPAEAAQHLPAGHAGMPDTIRVGGGGGAGGGGHVVPAGGGGGGGPLPVIDEAAIKVLNAIKAAIDSCCDKISGAVAKLAVAPAGGGLAVVGGGAATGGGAKATADATNKQLEGQEKILHVLEEEEEIGRESLRTQRSYNKLLWARMSLYNDMKRMLFSIENTIMGFTEKGQSALDTLFGGVIKDEVLFIKDVRAAAYEVAGVTGESKLLQRQWENIGTTVKQTGVDRTKFQQAYLKTVKGGIRDLKVAHAVTVAQLNTERQLGMAAGDLGDAFHKWTLEGRMSEMQIAEMGRGMREVARNTGLTGDALKTALGTGQQYITMLRNAAQLTAASAKNVLEIAANAQKLGVQQQMDPLIRAMSSSAELLLKASSETRNVLFVAASKVGRVQDLLEGTVTRTKEGVKDMARGMEEILKGFGVESLEAIDQMSDAAKFKVNVTLKAAYGMELGEFRQSIIAMKESGKGLADRLADINKEREKNLTLEEKATLMEKERALRMSASLSMLTALDEATKGAQNMDQALAKFSERRKDFEGDLQAMGHSWTTSAGAAKTAIEESLKTINAGLLKAGKQELKISTKDIEEALKDPTKFRELGAQLSKGEQELATAQKAQLDPMSKLNQTMMEVNDSIRNFSQKAIHHLLALVGTTGLIATLVATTIGKGILNLITLNKQGLGTIFPVLKKIPYLGPRIFGDFEDELEKKVAAKVPSQTPGGPAPTGPKLPGAPTTTTAGGLLGLKGPEAPALTPTSDDTTHSILQKSLQQLIRILAEIRHCVCRMSDKAVGPRDLGMSKTQQAEYTAGAKAQKEKMKEELKGLTPAQQKEKGKEIAARLRGERIQAAAQTGDPRVHQELLKRQEGLLKREEKMVTNMGPKGVAGQLKRESILQRKEAGLLKQAEVAGPGAGALKATSAGGVDKTLTGKLEGIKKVLNELPDMKEAAQVAGKLFKAAGAFALMAAPIIALMAAMVLLVKAAARAPISPAEAMKAAFTIATTIAAAGIIGLAIFGARKGMAQPEFSTLLDIKGTVQMVGQMFRVAGSLALLSTPILAIMLAMYILVKAIARAPINPSEAMKAAFTIATTIGAAGVIGAALWGADWAMKQKEFKILKNIKLAQRFAMNMWRVTASLGLLSLPILAVMTAMYALVKLIALAPISPTEALKAAFTIATTFLAAGVIGAALWGADWAMKQKEFKLLKNVRLAQRFAGNMWRVTASLGILSLPILAIMAAMYLLVKLVAKAPISPIEAMKAATTIAVTFLAAGIVGGALWVADLGMKQPEFKMLKNVRLAKRFAGNMWRVAASLGILSLPILAVMAAMYGLVKVILKSPITGGDALKVATTIATTVFAAGVVGGALWLADKGMKQPEFKILKDKAKVKELQQELFQAAQGLAMMALPILAVMAAMYLLVKAIAKAPITPSEALKAAFTITVTLIAAGSIGAAIYGADKYMKYMPTIGKAAKLAWQMTKSAIAIGLVMIPTTILLAAMILFIKMIEGMWTLEEAKYAAKLVAATFTAIGIVALGFTAAAAAMMGLGVLAKFAWKLIAAAYLGIIALALLTIPVLALFAAMVLFIKALEALWTVKEAEQAAKLVEASFSAMGLVAIGIVVAGAALIGLGALAYTAPIIIGYAYMGIGAFIAIGIPVLALAAAIILFIKALEGLWTVQQAEEAVKLVQASFTAFGLVAAGIAVGAGIMIGLGALVWAAPIIIGYAWLGIGALIAIGIPVLALAAALIAFIKVLEGLWTVAQAKEAADLTYYTFEAMGITALGILIGGGLLVAFGSLGLGVFWIVGYAWLGIFALALMTPPIAALAAAIIFFIEFLRGLWTVAQAKEAVDLVNYSFEAMGKVALGIIVAGALLAGFGALGWTALWIVKLAWIGIIALALMSPPIIVLGAAILGFIKVLEGLWGTAAKAQDMAKMVEAVFDAMGTVAWNIIKYGALLAGFGLLGWWAVFIAAMMWAGIVAFGIMAQPVQFFIRALLDLGRAIIQGTSAEEAKQIADSFKTLIEAGGVVLKGVEEIKGILIKMGGPSFWGWITGKSAVTEAYETAGMMRKGIIVFGIVKEPVKDFVKQVIDFGEAITANIDAEDAKEIADNVTALMKTMGVVLKAVQESKETLIKMAGRSVWSWITGKSAEKQAEETAETMRTGITVFTTFSKPVKDFAKKVVEFGQEITTSLDADDAKELSDNVQALMKTMGITLQAVQDSKTILMKMGGGSFWAWITGKGAVKEAQQTADLMRTGISVFEEISRPIPDFISKLVDFGTMVTSTIGEDEAKKLGDNLQTVMKAGGAVLDSVNKAKETLVKLGGGSFWSWITGKGAIKEAQETADMMTKGAEVFDIIAAPVVPFISSLMGLGAQITGSMPEEQAKKLGEALETTLKAGGAVFDAVAKTRQTLEELGKTQFKGGFFFWVTKSAKEAATDTANMMEKGAEAFQIIAAPVVPFIASLVGMGRGITGGMSPEEAKKLGEAIGSTLKSGTAVFKAIEKAQRLLSRQPSSTVAKIIADWMWDAVKAFEIMSSPVVYLLRAVLAAAKSIGPAKEAQDAAETMKAIIPVLKAIPKIIHQVVTRLIPIVEKGTHGVSAKDLLAKADEFDKFFSSLATFLGRGIIDPIFYVIGDPRDVKIAADVMKSLVPLIAYIPPVVRMVARNLIPMIEEGTKANEIASKINTSTTKEFNKFFMTLSKFLGQGIIDPIFKVIGDPRDVKIAAEVMKALVPLIASIPPVVWMTVYGLLPMVDAGKYAGQMAKKIDEETTKKFNTFFSVLANFLGKGIIDPIFKVIGDPRDVKIAAESMKAMVPLIASIPPVVWMTVYGLLPMVDAGTYAGKVAANLDAKTTKAFSTFFWALARFLGKGIIDPIFYVIGDPRDVKIASESMQALVPLIKSIPPVIYGIQYGLVPLMQAGDDLAGNVLTQLENSTDNYQDFFKGVFNFIGHGIVDPIIYDIGDPRDLSIAAMSLAGAVRLINLLPKFIVDLANSIKWFNDPPREPNVKTMGDAVKKFGEWFGGISRALGDGIFIPIKTTFPKPQEVQEAQAQLQGMVDLVKKLPKFIEDLAKEMDTFSKAPWWRMQGVIAAQVTIFSEFFRTIAVALGKGILEPIRKYFPESAFFVEVNGRLDGVRNMLPKVGAMIDALSNEMKRLGGTIGVAAQMLNTAWDLFAFGTFFRNIAWNLKAGMIDPVRQWFPPAKVFQELIARLEMVPKFLPAVRKVCEDITNEIKDYGQSFFGIWWRSVKMNWKFRDFAAYFTDIARGISEGMIQPVQVWFPPSSELADLLKRLEIVQKLIPEVRKTIDKMMEEVNKFGREFPTWEDQSKKQMDAFRFAIFFRSLALSISIGIIDPIWRYFPHSRKLEEVVKEIDAVSRILPKVNEVVDAVTTQMNKLNTGPDWDIDLADSTNKFANFFKGAAEAIRTGIIDPIKENFADTEELEGVIDSLEVLNDVLGEMDTVIATLSGTLAGLADVDVDVSGLTKINFGQISDVATTLSKMPPLDAGQLANYMAGGNATASFVNPAALGPGGAGAAPGGGVTPAAAPPKAAGGMAGMDKAMGAALVRANAGPRAPGAAPGGPDEIQQTQDVGVEEALRELISTMVYTQKTQNRFSEQTITTSSQQSTQANVTGVDRAVTGSAKITSKAVADSTTNLTGRITGISQTVGDSVRAATGPLTTSFNQWRDRQTQQQQQQQQAQQQNQQAQAQANQGMTDLANQGLQRGSIYVHDVETMGAVNRLIQTLGGATGVRLEAATEQPATQVAVAQSMTDLHTAMQQRYATDQAPAAATGPLAEMAELTKLTAQTLAVEQEQKELLAKLVEYFKPKPAPVTGMGGEPRRTQNRTIPGRPPRFPDVPMGQAVQSANLGVLPNNFANS
jgi:hypothetical protein